MFKLLWHALRGVALFGAGLVAVPVTAGPLGIAGDYNEFILGDVSRVKSTTEGSLAVGGNLNIDQATIAQKMPGAGTNNSAVNLVVGGNLTGSRGSINGSTVVGGNVNYTSPSMGGNLSANGSVTLGGSGGSISGDLKYGTTYSNPSSAYVGGTVAQQTTAPPVDFAKEFARLRELSMAQIDGSVAANYSYGALTFDGVSGINQFSVTEAQMESAWGLYFNAPADATIIINVAGTDVNFPGAGFSLNGISSDRIIFNFYEATTLTLSSFISGSILAPNAVIRSDGATVAGNIIAAGITGLTGSASQLSTRLVPFNGELIAIPSPAPEPANLGLFAAGLGLIAFGRRAARRAGGGALPAPTAA